MIELIKEASYEEQMNQIVLPALSLAKHQGTLAVSKDISIHYVWYEKERAKGNIVLVHGYTENAEKHSEMAYYFLQAGYQVFSLDQRGHGFSTREVSPEDVTHINAMSDYVDDLTTFVEKVVKRNGKKLPIYGYGHSMGGAVVILTQLAHPHLFKKLILCAPMIEPITGDLPFWAAKLISTTLTKCGKGTQPMIGATYYHAPEPYTKRGTSSPIRFSYFAKKKELERKYQNACPTYGWIAAACTVKKTVNKKKALSNLTEPVLLLQAELDEFVRTKPQTKWMAKVTNGTLIPMAQATHEIYLGEDETVARFLEEILNFLK